jgi:hypothetical protein
MKSFKIIAFLFLMNVFCFSANAQWSASGSQVWTTTLTTNVGIGTGSPGTKLHVATSGGHNYLRLDKSADTYENGIQFSKNNTPQFYFFSDDGSNALKITSTGASGETDALPRIQFPYATKDVYLVQSGGNVGIGTSSPGARLSFADVSSTTLGEGITWYNPSPTEYGIYRTAGTWVAPNYQQMKIKFATGIVLDPGTAYGKSYVDIQGGGLRVTAGNVGIGTANPDAKLAVKGVIHAEEVKVDLSVPGPDYVFESTYKLPTLQELQLYIAQNKHLPEVPSAKEMEQNGINVGEMNMILLKKVEELTLYLIELKREIQQLQAENKEMNALRKEVELLKK